MESISKLPISGLKIIEDLDFEVIKEEWNEYKVTDDDSQIKLKTVIAKIFKTNITDQATGLPVYGTAYQNVLSVKSSTKGEPSDRLPSPSEIPNMPKSEVNFITVKEDWNSYKIKDEGKDFIFEIKSIVTQIYRIDGFYDQLGYPYYWVLSQQVSRVRKI